MTDPARGGIYWWALGELAQPALVLAGRFWETPETWGPSVTHWLDEQGTDPA